MQNIFFPSFSIYLATLFPEIRKLLSVVYAEILETFQNLYTTEEEKNKVSTEECNNFLSINVFLVILLECGSRQSEAQKIMMLQKFLYHQDKKNPNTPKS